MPDPLSMEAGMASPSRLAGGPASAGTVNPVSDAAGLTRDQWNNFLTFYRPIEDDVIKSAMQTDFTKEGNDAGTLAAAGVNASKGMLERNLRRAGGTLSAEERTAVDRRVGSTLSQSVTRAENITRRGLSETRTSLLQGIVNIGQGVQQTASAGMNSVADMAHQREVQYQQLKSATAASNMSSAATAASLLIAFV